MKVIQDQLKALETWYPPDHPLYKDPEHPLLGLVGEAGEIVDQWKKHRFKPGYQCSREGFLDELGDLWYYLRILCWLTEFRPLTTPLDPGANDGIVLVNLSHQCSKLAYKYEIFSKQERKQSLIHITSFLKYRLGNLDCDLDELTELNYQKLKGRHGWEHD